jgi:phosphoribosylanthranilate isomerase
VTRVKVCGFTRPADVRSALDAGVDAFGFNVARGPRRIEPAQAAELARLVPPGCTTIALFVDADEHSIEQIMGQTRCAVAQLHGDEPPELVERLSRRFPVIKAMRIRDAASFDQACAYTAADALLLDAWSPHAHGGTGTAFDHSLVQTDRLPAPLILAGGLGPANVAEAVASVKPWMVDCASGVESAPGVKDAARMAALVHATRGASA